MGPDFLEVVGFLACVIAIIGSAVGVIIWIFSSLEAWREIRKLRASVAELEVGDEKWADDVVSRITALEIAAKRKAAK